MSKEHDLRIGQFAVAKGMISASQLSQCLRIQNQYKQQGHSCPLVDILQQQNFLSISQIEEMYRTTVGDNTLIQRQFQPTFIDERYEVLAELGRGGMGIVYKAHDQVLGRTVAIKILRDTDRDKVASARFLREAKAMSSLKHSNIVEIYDIVLSHHFHYIVMEYIDGDNLRKYMTRNKVGIKQAVRITISVLEALHHTHEEGVIHRDIKPDNIMISSSGVKVMDFGLAKIVDDKKQLSKTSFAIGTVHYMSPEQMAGERKKVGITSDLYSVGVTLYEVLSGKTPFVAKSLAEALTKVKKNFALLHTISPKIPKQLSVICAKSIEKKRQNRYSNAREFIEDLQNFLDKKKNRHAVKTYHLIFISLGILFTTLFYLFSTSTLERNSAKKNISIRPTPKETNKVILYRGNAARTGNYSFSPNKNKPTIKWTFATQGRLKSSPVIHKDIVYFGSYDYFLYALHTDNGQLLWKFRAQNYVYTSPAIDNNQIYVGSHDTYLYALDIKDGSLKWKFKTLAMILSSPLIWKDNVYFGSHDSNIYVLNAKDGNLVWNYRTKGKILASPSAYKNAIYVGSMDGNLYSFSTNGDIRWKFSTRGGIKSTAAIENDTVFFGNFAHQMYAVKTNGEVKWKTNIKGEVHSSPSLSKNNLYIGSNDGHLYVLDKKNGSIKWKYFTQKPIIMSPSVYDETVYFSSLNGFLYCATHTGEMVWNLNLDAAYTSPIFNKKQVLFAAGASGFFYALE